MNQNKTQLIFIYNANAGLLHATIDTLHKWLSPSTYACQLCRITHHGFGMMTRMRKYLDSLDMELVFLHRDDYEEQIPFPVELPAILKRSNDEVRIILDNQAINECSDLEQLLQRLERALR